MSWAHRKDNRDPEKPRYRRGSGRTSGWCGSRCDFHCIRRFLGLAETEVLAFVEAAIREGQPEMLTLKVVK